MKRLLKLLAIAVPMLVVIVLSACSSDDGPKLNEDKTEKIDVNFLKSLARGETAITFDADTVIWYSKVYYPIYGDVDTLENGWIECRNMPIDGWMWPAYTNITISDGKVWHKVNLSHAARNFSLVYEPWKIYCKKTGFSKQIYVSCPFEYDIEQTTINFYGDKYDIDQADDNTLRISQTTFNSDPALTDTQRDESGFKTELSFKKGILEEFDPDQIMCFGSNNEAKIAMVKMMRQYFGDIINLNDYSDEFVFVTSGVDKYPVIDLAQLEYDLTNGLYEFDNWYKYNENR